MKTKIWMQYTALSLAISLTISACKKDSVELPAADMVKAEPSATAQRPENSQGVTLTTQQEIPISARWFAYCANNGNGEYINVSGTFHLVVHTVINAYSSHSIRISNHRNVKAIGETTGYQYEIIGVGTSVNNVNRNTTMTVNLSLLRIVGPRQGSADEIRVFARGTITPDGNFRADWETSTVGCIGDIND